LDKPAQVASRTPQADQLARVAHSTVFARNYGEAALENLKGGILECRRESEAD
jgi:hypothetical protein